MPKTLLTIDFIRHGEPLGGRKFRGNGCDDPLSEHGWQQMWQAVGEHAPWERIISSPMQRCCQFAEQLAEKHALNLAIETALKEIGMGDWEGRTPVEVSNSDPETYRQYYLQPESGRPKGAEDLTSFHDRIAKTFERIVENQHQGHLLIVAHAGVMRAMLGIILQAPAKSWYRSKVDYAGISRYRLTEFGWLLDFHNRHNLD